MIGPTFRATRKIKTCCGFQDRVDIFKGSYFVGNIGYDIFCDLFPVRMADGETVEFRAWAWGLDLTKAPRLTEEK